MADPPRREDETKVPNLGDALGGPLGMAETALPAVAFVTAYSASGQDVNVSAVVALVVAVGLGVVRLVRRESLRHVLTGIVGVAFAAFVATRSGKAENFFLPGLLANAAYATAFLVSIAIRRPIVGYVVGSLDGEGTTWRWDPVRLRVFQRASWLWAGLFLLRLAVQLPLYLAGAVVALGVARTAMGVPLFALGVYVTYRLVAAHRRPQTAAA